MRQVKKLNSARLCGVYAPKEEIICITNDKNMLKVLSKNGEEYNISLLENIYASSQIMDYIFLECGNGDTILFNIEDRTQKKLPQQMISAKFMEDNKFLAYGNEKVSLYNNKSLELLFSVPYVPPGKGYWYNEQMYTSSNSLLSCFNTSSELLWAKEFSFQFNDFIGVNNHLYLQTSTHLLKLDVDSGEVLGEIPRKAINLLKYENALISVGGNSSAFAIISLEDFSLKRVEIDNGSDEYIGQNWTLFKNELWATDNNFGKRLLFQVDVKTGNIIESIKVGEEKDRRHNLQAPHFHEDRVYINDDGGNLYIYER